MKFLLGVLTGFALAGAGALLYARSGRFDMAATTKAGRVERGAGEVLLESWLRRAPAAANPLGAAPAAVSLGLDHYRENCLVCHGAPGVRPTEIARGMNPPPVDLAQPEFQRLSDGQLYFAISHGIRMTGMPAFAPTHDEREIWALVSFVRRLPHLSEAERAALASAGEGEEEHHHH